MSNTSSEISSVCANCGKGEEVGSNLKACTACKLVKYCSRDCQIAHRPQHKKQCKKRAKELHEIELFKQPPPMEDCPICMIRLPTLESGKIYMSCCGKIICSGCVHAFRSRAYEAGRVEEDDICPFRRTPPPDSEEVMKRYEKRIELNDANAICNLGSLYSQGLNGLPQNFAKALELWHRAAELGNADAYYNIGSTYELGNGNEIDRKKAIHYLEFAAMGGQTDARHNLGGMEVQGMEVHEGNINRALKHYMIAVKDGNSDSLEIIKLFYSKGLATKDDYAKSLRTYQAYLDEIKSDQRDEAAAFDDEYKYYEL